jgi:Na+/H+-dicarboxylate symporter
VNVCGDAAVATIVAKSEGKFDESVFYKDESRPL